MEAESGLKVIAIGAEEDAMVRVTIDTRTAENGTWMISVEGEHGACTALLVVEAA